MNFSGLYTAIITPFTDEDLIDYNSYASLIERQYEAGVHGIICCGTTGESPTLSHEEHRKLIQKTIELVAGRMQVIAGTGSNSTQEAISLSSLACDDGADALMLVTPYYNKPTQEGIYRHFWEIAENCSKPIILYNIPGRTAVNIEIPTLERLAEHPNIQGIKEASGDINQMVNMKLYCTSKKDFHLFGGDDNITPAFMGLGGDGIISVASNIYPNKMVQIIKSYLNRESETANELFYNILPFCNALFWETNPIGVKAAASIFGLCNEKMRLPLVPLSTDKKEELRKIMKFLGEDK